MISSANLSLDQAPPIHLPLRLLLTAPWFAAAAGVLAMAAGEGALASRWTPTALALTHLITIGFLGQAMCGALLQMLPVIAGAPVPGVVWVAPTVHIALGAGAGFLAAGLYGVGSWALGLGAASALLGFTVFLAAVGVALTRARGSAAIVVALRLGVWSLVPTLTLGVALTGVLLGWVVLPEFWPWVDLHLTWGLFGWVGLLVLGAGYQLVPMLHVTPPYPPALTRWLAPLLFTALVLVSLATLFQWVHLARLGWGLLALGFGLFALVTLRLQLRRGRPRRDAALLHWWFALGAGVLAALVWAGGAPDALVGVLLLIGVGVGLPSGMLFKIVPFLCWFHLQQRQIGKGRFDVRVPHMRVLLPERLTFWHLALHLAALTTLAAASVEPRLTSVGGAMLLFSALWLAGLLFFAVRRYRLTRLALDSEGAPPGPSP